jgi:RNA polymerase sigma-32 factor
VFENEIKRVRIIVRPPPGGAARLVHGTPRDMRTLRTQKMSRQTYLSLINQYPCLSREEELALARRWRDLRDVAARDRLIKGNLRHVVTIARRYKPQKTTLDELVAEGSFGLVHALSKFEPERGLRLVTYAAYWIRTYILTHLLRCRTVVDVGIHSKLLAKVSRERRRIAAKLGRADNLDAELATQLGLAPERLRSLIERLDVCEVSFDKPPEHGLHLEETLHSPSLSAEDLVVSVETGMRVKTGVSQALQGLDDRERYIIEHRVMANPEEELSLAEIARQFGVSRERARQIELRAMRKARRALSYLTGVESDAA